MLGHHEDGGQQPSKPGLPTEAWRRAVGREHQATSTPSDEPPFLLQRYQFQPLKAARDFRAIMPKQSGPRSQSDKISPTELCLPVLLPITAKPVAFWEGLKARKKKCSFSHKPRFVLALSVCPQANPYLPNELTGKEQKSLVCKEEISHSISEVVNTLSQLRSVVTN